MDMSKQLKQAIVSGNLLFGLRQAQDACKNGEAKVVIFAANCPTEFTDQLHEDHPEVIMHRLPIVNRELGIACGKPFSVSTVPVIDAGSSDLLTLDSNL